LSEKVEINYKKGYFYTTFIIKIKKIMKTNLFIVTVLFLLFTTGNLKSQTGNSDKPNIVFIEVDDLREGYTSFTGSDIINTPNIDKLAETGVYFGNASCQGMMCGPSRNSLITGLYPHNLGFYINGELKALPKGVWTFPQALQRAGYYTAWVGKCHVRPGGKDKTLSMKNRMGFDFVQQTLGRVMLCKKLNSGKPVNNDWYIDYLKSIDKLDEFKNGCNKISTLADNEYLDGFFTQNAKKFIDNYNKKEPFFLWINYTLPHGPFDVPEKYHTYNPEDMPGFTTEKNYKSPENLVKKTKYISSIKKIKEYQSGYYANISFLDMQVKEVVDAIKEKGIYDNTMIVFFSDHGLMMGDHHRIHKGTLFREITNPVLIVSSPAKMKQNIIVEQPVELIDLIHTTLTLADAKKADIEKRPYSVNLLPALYKNNKIDRKYAFGEIEGYIMASDGEYRLIKGYNGNDFYLLFNDKNDPKNLLNIADENPEKVKELSNAINEWLKETGKPLPPKTY
jgi:arylsulfatase A-like enzyme